MKESPPVWVKYLRYLLLSLFLWGVFGYLANAPFITAPALLRIFSVAAAVFFGVLLINIGQLMLAVFAPHKMNKKQ